MIFIKLRNCPGLDNQEKLWNKKENYATNINSVYTNCESKIKRKITLPPNFIILSLSEFREKIHKYRFLISVLPAGKIFNSNYHWDCIYKNSYNSKRNR